MRFTRVYWETKDGRLLELCQMSTTHILNCIAKIERSVLANKPWRVKALPYLKEELKDRRRILALLEDPDDIYWED